ncbi:hypothetical protein [Oscillatoria sp. FACHB-1406]|uniref:hypothetical protein n=1 Tax=Oscillatoria sp. FACHB-1406 TaxID=2692846 RepID=UPI001684604C|nr:hypothetical protein [Oscillatoria sp. FACHB-1406]MBD2578653.1 hypothetical protein [Oscillatoria sp. FACHB-1406]
MEAVATIIAKRSRFSFNIVATPQHPGEKNMLEIVLNWKPDTKVLTQLMQVAYQENKSLESLFEDAIAQYLQARLSPQNAPKSPAIPDPLIGLYDGR